MLGTVIATMLSGFVTGALARLAVPGPDPMPAWLTVSIGLVGSVIGLGAAAATHGNAFVGSVVSFGAAVLLVVLYRKIVQGRPVFGPEALRFPRRGIGVGDYRQRLQRAGVDPDALLDRAIAAREEQERREQERHEQEGEEEPRREQVPRRAERDEESESGSEEREER